MCKISKIPFHTHVEAKFMRAPDSSKKMIFAFKAFLLKHNRNLYTFFSNLLQICSKVVKSFEEAHPSNSVFQFQKNVSLTVKRIDNYR